jgi:hypothetical protein
MMIDFIYARIAIVGYDLFEFRRKSAKLTAYCRYSISALKTLPVEKPRAYNSQ